MASSLTITPTTTVSAETSNNTSAATTFTAQSNGNIAAGNVSKVETRTLLYPGAVTKIYAHFMGWFGPSNHMSVGYNSADSSQVQRQIDDMVSRGMDGAIIDWYGPGHYPDDTATQMMMSYAQTLPGVPFKFAVMEDVGALGGCANTYGCDLTKTLVSHLTYVHDNYEGSPAYMTVNGQPVVFFFGLESYNINWAYVKANVPGNPAFIFQNGDGFRHAESAGAFGWVMINLSNPNDWKQSYLDSFYQSAVDSSAKHAFGAVYAGFNDTLASWSLRRVMNQNCGQTWLNTWNEIGKYYNSGRQLESIQIPTWNDYEEGTEIETGIENCVALSASVTDNTLSWTLTGNENTIDHYTVFLSVDGQNLMPLLNASTGVRKVDLAALGIAPGTYTVYVKAVGRPSITNKMSAAVAYNVPDPGPTVVLTVTPTSGVAPVTVTVSTQGSSSPGGTIEVSVIDFGDGTKVSGTTATHTYTSAGTYTVTATLTDSMKVSATGTATVLVAANKPPLASLSVGPASGTAPLTVTASTAASSDLDGTIVGSQINFGDGTVVNATTATHTYTVPGTYRISATVTDNCGLSASDSATVSVLSVPGKVTINSPTNGAIVNSPVRVVASATANTGNVITAMRIYVDSTDAYTVSASSVDTGLVMGPGAHSIVVQAWDNTGAVYQSTLNITVPNRPPAVAFTVSPTACVTGAAVSASMVGTSDPDGSIASYAINFGDGTVVHAVSGSHSYAIAGTYSLTATATDNLGASTTLTRTVTVTAPAPVGGVSVISPANGATLVNAVHFLATATSQYPVTAMRIYVDNVSMYTVSAAKVDTYLNLPVGPHYVVVQAWDSSGAVFKTAANITVQSALGRASVN